MTDNERIAELLLPNIDKTPDYYEKLYPERDLPEGARVTRFAPSPTGFLHLGGLFGATADRFTASATKGSFILRIEDTDKKREIDDGVTAIIEGLSSFGILPDEGVTGADSETGEYGPYVQSKRKDIYQCFVKDLIKKGLAYPCFCSSEKLDEIRRSQEEAGVNKGYYGSWAKCRDLCFDEIEQKVKSGEPYVIRFRSMGDENKKCYFDDVIRGKIEMPENVQDIVLLKTDGIPTYHFAHVVDDHLMRVTHAIRGDEWIASTPIHLQLFASCGFNPPKYAHTAAIMKEDGAGKRKLSKRKDPEAAVSYFTEQGYPSECVIEYLLTLANSNFEDWRKTNKTEPQTKFPFNLKKMSISGALFDQNKLNDVSKIIIAAMPSNEVYEKLCIWAKTYDPDFYTLIVKNPEFVTMMLAIDRDNAKNPRKDIAKWSEVKDYYSYFFNSLYTPEYELPENISAGDAVTFLTEYKNVYDAEDDRQAWFEKIKQLCPALGFAAETKEYKKDPSAYKGSAGDLSTVLRIAITSRRNTPDLCSIMATLGKDECIARIDNMIDALSIGA